VHLQAASAYLIPLKSAKPCWRLEKSGPLAFASMENGNRPCGRNEGVDIDDVIKTITAILIALDILSSASTRSPSLLQVDHEQILRHGDIQLSDIMGCDTRVMVLIGQVSALDEWKRACEANCRLSVMELGKRADSIEMSLDEFLYATESTLEDAACSLTGEGPGVIPSHETSQFITKLISNVFALAAITYLHVVVSGNNPDLEEIQDSVSKTIAAIKRLPDISLLRRIVWPFCVTGCLASGEQVKDLQSMAERAGITCNTPGGLWKAVKAMEECERMREENMGNQDWVMAMSFLGSQVLLL
jgi:C6 transcription factor Pro1